MGCARRRMRRSCWWPWRRHDPRKRPRIGASYSTCTKCLVPPRAPKSPRSASRTGTTAEGPRRGARRARSSETSRRSRRRRRSTGRSRRGARSGSRGRGRGSGARRRGRSPPRSPRAARRWLGGRAPRAARARGRVASPLPRGRARREGSKTWLPWKTQVRTVLPRRMSARTQKLNRWSPIGSSMSGCTERVVADPGACVQPPRGDRSSSSSSVSA